MQAANAEYQRQNNTNSNGNPMYYFHICWVHKRFEWQMCKSRSNRNVVPKVQTPAAQHASCHRGAIESDQCCNRLVCSVAAGPEPEARLEAVPSQV
jgi:hypothetical protein